jgi:hypothetical protein
MNHISVTSVLLISYLSPNIQTHTKTKVQMLLYRIWGMSAFTVSLVIWFLQSRELLKSLQFYINMQALQLIVWWRSFMILGVFTLRGYFPLKGIILTC